MAWKMTHPDSDQTIEVEADAVPMYQTQGWLTFKDKPPVDTSDDAVTVITED
jgi:hypothetical protein